MYKASGGDFSLSEEELKTVLSNNFDIIDIHRDGAGNLVDFKVKPKKDKTPDLLKDGVEISRTREGLGIRFVHSAFSEEEYMKLRSIVGVIAKNLGLVIEDPAIDAKDMDPADLIQEEYFDYISQGGDNASSINENFLKAMKSLK